MTDNTTGMLTPTNNTSQPVDNHKFTSTESIGDATHLTSGATTSELLAIAEMPAARPPSDPILNSDAIDAPLVSQLREAPIDPRVVALRALFPDYDDLILCVSKLDSDYL